MATEVKAEAPVVEVTVLEDRAHVLRRGKVRLVQGAQRILVEGVAPVLADKTVSATAGAAQVVSARVERRRVYLAAEKPEEIRSLDDLAAEKARERTRLEAALALLVERQAALERLADEVMDEIVADSSWGTTAPSTGAQRLDVLRERLDEASRDAVTLREDIADIDRTLAGVESRRRARQSPSSAMRASVVVEVTSAEAGEVELTVGYVVPGAAWRPYHTARLSLGEKPELHLRAEACVWQATGEAWEDVKLWLSTERPSLGVTPPKLATDKLASRKKGPEVQVEAREQKIHTAGLGAGEKVKVPEVPGIDDGGEARRLESRTRATIPSDGRPYRVPLFDFTSPARSELVVMGEVAEAVIRRSEQVHKGDRPILPGPVDLIEESGIVGRTQIGFVAPGEKFELGFGPDASLRVHREHERLEEESKLLSTWVTTPHRVKLSLSNLGPAARTVNVTERVPVSEIDKVVITSEPKHTTAEATPDKDGFVRWTIALPPFGRKAVTLGYTIKKHPSVTGI